MAMQDERNGAKSAFTKGVNLRSGYQYSFYAQDSPMHTRIHHGREHITTALNI